MRNYIIADNQELTAYALQSLLKRDEGSAQSCFLTIPCLILPTRTSC